MDQLVAKFRLLTHMRPTGRVLRLQRAAKLVQVHPALPANEIHTCAVCVTLIVSLSKTPFNAADSVAE
jgi:hypothetical protein